MPESTLVIVKPDGYERGLTGSILARLEQRGLKLEAIRVSHGERHLVQQHYPSSDDSWLAAAGRKSLDEYDRLGISPVERLGTDDPIQIGRLVHSWLIDYLLSAPMVPMVLSGPRVIETVRKLVGFTIPISAEPGTIRGDFSNDSSSIANEERRAVRNLVHASGDADEARREIKLWFPDYNY